MALLDVREHGQYGEGHPFFSIHAPYSRLEPEVRRLVPRLTTRVVLLDSGEDDSALSRSASRRLAAIGYTAVSILKGGTPAWAQAGRTLFQGVNLPSKTFGEAVEHGFDVPHWSAQDLAARLATSEPLLLLDGRTLAEHRLMTLPGAIPMPNGELALRWPTLVDDTTTPIVVHCAGRTRSIIGAQILRDLGVPNPVFALENGTQGWALAGLELERGSTRAVPSAPERGSAKWRAAEAAMAASSHGSRRALRVDEAQGWLDDSDRTTFVFDVRTAAEFSAGSLPGARHAPGGQLLQATDLQIGVRHARVLLLDDDGIRAPVIAGWLRRLGWEAAHVEGGVASGLRVPAPASAPPTVSLPRWGEAALRGLRLDADPSAPPIVLDLRPSPAHRHGHAAGSRWSIRPRVVADAHEISQGDRARRVLLVADDQTVAQLAAIDLREAGWADLAYASVDDVKSAGWRDVRTPDVPSDEESIDYLFFVHDRHQGNLDAARRYLEWETGLIAQCAPDELGVFRMDT